MIAAEIGDLIYRVRRKQSEVFSGAEDYFARSTASHEAAFFAHMP
jgi:hypothetical protein